MSDADQRPAWKAEIERLNRQLAEANRRITDLEEKVAHLESGSEQQDKLQKIVAHADRISNGEDSAVLDYKQVMAAADVSHQTAYTYMDKLVDQTEFVEERPTPDGLKRILVDTTVSNPFRKE